MGNQKKPRRPPRQVWLVVDRYGVPRWDVYSRRKDAQARVDTTYADEVRVAGPYVLAERVGQR